MYKLICLAVAGACVLAALDQPRPNKTYHSSGGASAQPWDAVPELRHEPSAVSGALDLADTLKRHGVNFAWYPTPGVHEWKVWRHALAEFAQKVFQETHQ